MLKMVAVSVVAMALWWVATHFPGRILAPVLIAVTIGLIGTWSNVAFGLVG